MFKFALRFFLLFIFVIYAQLTMAEETNNQFDFPDIIANYTLTEDLLLKMEKVGKEYENSPPEPKASNIPYDISIEEFTSYISDQPILMDILKNNNITPKDFVIGLTAFKTLIIISESISEDIKNLKKRGNSLDEKNTVVLNNLEFSKKHWYKILTIFDYFKKMF